MSLERQRLEVGDELRNAAVTISRLAATSFTSGTLSEYEARKVVRAARALQEIADKIVTDTAGEAA